jgi:hypothetical protein
MIQEAVKLWRKAKQSGQCRSVGGERKCCREGFGCVEKKRYEGWVL